MLHNIPLSEDMAEKLCPELGQRGAETEEALNALRLKVAKCCKRQGNYHLACKKYPSARHHTRTPYATRRTKPPTPTATLTFAQVHAGRR